MNQDKADSANFRNEAPHTDRLHAELQQLQEQKAKLDIQYQERMKKLQQEKVESDQLFEERLMRLRQDEQYKDDLLQGRIIGLTEERVSYEQKYLEKVAHLQQQQAAAERDYQDKMERIRQREVEADEKHRDKMAKAGQEIQQKIDALNVEILRLEKQYQETMADMQADTGYKRRIIEDRAEFIRDWDEEQHKFNHRLAELQQDKIEVDKEYEQKIAVLRQEIQYNDTGLQEKINQLTREKQVQLELIQDKITQVQQEKMRQDELYQIRLEKIQQDQLYYQRMNRLKEDTLMVEKTHAETQQQLVRERDNMEANFLQSRESNRVPSLKRLKEIEKEFEVADKHLDVRGWEVIGNKGEKIGKVEELIVDVEAMKVRYLDVHIPAGQDTTNRHVLIPIGAATIDKSDDNVLVPNLDRAMVMKCPSYTGETVTRDYEHTLLTTLSPEYNLRPTSREDFYKQEPFNDKRFYNSDGKDKI